MKTDFIVNPRDPTIVDVWLGDVFLGELHTTERGFRLLTPGRVGVNKLPAEPVGADVRPLESLEVIITPED